MHWRWPTARGVHLSFRPPSHPWPSSCAPPPRSQPSAKKRLETAIGHDTTFLGALGVMDYSLLVGLDAGRGELVVGIIDYVRQYTWDKQLETWVKVRGAGVEGAALESNSRCGRVAR